MPVTIHDAGFPATRAGRGPDGACDPDWASA
jgi:hypothetical protein